MAAPGHLRPLASLACKIVKERNDVAITFFCVARYYRQLECEISRYFSTSVADSEAKANIRRVALACIYDSFMDYLEHSNFLDSSVLVVQKSRTGRCPSFMKHFQGITTSS